MKHWGIGLVVLIGTGVVAWRVYALVAVSPGQGGKHHGVSLTVDAVRAQRQAVPLTIQASGVAQTEHSVAVQAQVAGTLQKVLFQEGDEVKAGQLLFVIDPKPYQIAVAQAQGQVEQDQAKLASDRANAERMAKLIKSGYVSTQDNQTAEALVQQDEGTLAADQAKLDQAKLQLSYTEISAPIDGKTGALAFKSGNLIQANGATPLVTINQIAPILVQFNVPQSQMAQVLAHRDDKSLSVDVRGPDGSLLAGDGKLVFIDNTINQDTGTLSLKAEFPNADRMLWPGELLSVDLTLTVENDALVVPTIAVQPGQNGSYVYAIADGKVAVQNVVVAREYGGLTVISKGLAAGDVVVEHVPRELHGGMPAKARLLPFPTSAAAAASASAGA
ncbi:MAG: efflux RND transporter periplasmic adaptor subunit [Gammaproteobacteria bacterium]